MSVADYLDMHEARLAIIAEVGRQTAGFDAVLSPTVPIVAPKISDVSSSKDEYRRVNVLLLRNPSIVNLLDGCALSIPCHAHGDAPVGLMLAGPRLGDVVQYGLFDLGVALYGRYQIRDQVGTPLKVHVDLGESGLHVLILGDHLVLGADISTADKKKNDDKKGN